MDFHIPIRLNHDITFMNLRFRDGLNRQRLVVFIDIGFKIATFSRAAQSAVTRVVVDTVSSFKPSSSSYCASILFQTRVWCCRITCCVNASVWSHSSIIVELTAPFVFILKLFWRQNLALKSRPVPEHTRLNPDEKHFPISPMPTMQNIHNTISVYINRSTRLLKTPFFHLEGSIFSRRWEKDHLEASLISNKFYNHLFDRTIVEASDSGVAVAPEWQKKQRLQLAKHHCPMLPVARSQNRLWLRHHQSVRSAKQI